MILPTPVVRRLVRAMAWPVTSLRPAFATQRRLYAAYSMLQPVTRGTTVTHEVQGGVDCLRVVARGADPSRHVVHFHGGGFCIGSAREHRSFAAQLSAAAGVAVVLPDYRLAPEHRYPAAHDDAESAWRSLSGRAVAVSGDSAGGNLALSVCLRMREVNGPMPPCAVLISPGLDRTADRRSDAALAASDIILTPGWLDQCLDAYATTRDAAELNLLHADLRGLPPTLVIAGSAEILLPDADRFSLLARDAGVDISDLRGDGLWHIYPTQAGLLSAADHAVEVIGSHVRQHGCR